MTFLSFVIRLLAVLTVVTVMLQLYQFIATRNPFEREQACYPIGIIYVSVGTVILVTRDLLLVLLGFAMIGAGIKTLAIGLMRKSIKIR